ncbi:MAG TPA: glutamate--tRNA ligase family protein [Puia sp.]|nr:glutamate--tRNA ligase family protein [Puia sp.]
MKEILAFTRTRIAPTPSGYLHLGNILSFSLTVALARRAGASVLLRIDDLDRERVDRAYVRDLFETLRFMELPWDEGPEDAEEFERRYSQAHRMPLYAQALDLLRANGSVFACSCSRSQLRNGVYPGTCRDRGLSLDAQGVTWRLRTSPSARLRVKTLDGKDVVAGAPARGQDASGPGLPVGTAGVIESMLPAEMQDFVVRKKDGFPAYQLTSLVDDVHYDVDGIVRGEDLWPSTLAQLYLASCLPGMEAFAEARFYHHRLLTTDRGEKLSKSAGATSIQYLRREGRSAAEIYTDIARLLGRTVAVQGWEALAALVLG